MVQYRSNIGWFNMGPISVQYGSNMVQYRSNLDPIWFNIGPNWSQNGPKRVPKSLPSKSPKTDSPLFRTRVRRRSRISIKCGHKTSMIREVLKKSGLYKTAVKVIGNVFNTSRLILVLCLKHSIKTS